jgi:hypothetical protein
MVTPNTENVLLRRKSARARFMTKFLNPAEIDFLQGRVSASVFIKNYFNPILIGDLEKRVFKGIAELQTKIG